MRQCSLESGDAIFHERILPVETLAADTSIVKEKNKKQNFIIIVF
jgi:hypothetical protein